MSSENESGDIYKRGSFKGTTASMVQVGSEKGYAILQCRVCGEELPGNWNNASSHTCGLGEERDGAGCCDSPTLVDEWIVLDETESTTTKQRKKRCENCGQLHPLEVMSRV